MTISKMKPLPLDTRAWLSDAELRCLNPMERGFLIDLMCYAHSGSPYGFVTVSGEPMTDEMVSHLFHVDMATWKKTKTALIASHRIDIADGNGCIFIKRMVRDGALRAMATDYGSLGGNPSLLPGIADEPEPKTTSRGISASTYWNRLPMHLQTPEMRDAVNEWHDYRTRKKILLTKESMARQINQLIPLSPDQAVQWIQTAIDRNWRGLFPPPNGYSRQQKTQPDHRAERERKEYPRNARPEVI